MTQEKNILAAKKPRRKKPDFFDKEIGAAKQKEIADKIAKIYKDPNGHIPEMHKIKMRRKNPIVRFAFFLLFLTSLMAFFSWAGFLYFPQGEKFSEEKISLIIDGPTEVELGGTSTYKIIIKNNLAVPLKKLTLNTNYPDGFVFLQSDKPAQNLGNTEWSLSDLEALSETVLTISGKTYGSLEQQGSWRVFFSYQPSSLNSQMQKIATLNTKVSLTPFVLSVKSPEKAIYGTDTSIIYTLENKNGYLPEKMYLQLSLPEKFSIVSSTPGLDKENRWTISPTSSDYFPKEFRIVGRFSGELETEEDFKAVLELPVLAARQTYQIGQAENKIQLSRTAFLLTLAINGATNDFGARPGDPLNMTVNFKNAGKTSLKNASIALKLDAPALKRVSIMDWVELSDQLDGDIVGKQINDNLRNGTITWNKSKLKDLGEIKSSQEVSLDLRLPIKGADKINLSEIKENQIKATAEIIFTDEDKTQKTIASNPITITLNSDFTFEKRVEVTKTNDDKDKRNFTWILRNTFHPLKDIVLSAEVYGDVEFITSTIPAGKLNYDSKEKIINWTIDEMPESVDVLALSFSLMINKKNPTQQVLLSKIKIKATDKVTDQIITFMGSETLLFEEKTEEEDPFAR
ncbi:MAG TPA: hypothetical protein PKH95_00745 [Candidatus Magasanikbacteria bacterium]|nr:hypothetical protein [Candidatus Magasanikbacteria bacterium]